MSQENVETVRRMHETFARGDVEASLACFDPEIEFSTASGPDTATYHGIDGVRQATISWVGTWDDFHIDLEELTDLGDHVLARICERGRGKGSGVEVEREAFQLFSFRNDRIARLRMYIDEKEAPEAAGLSE